MISVFLKKKERQSMEQTIQILHLEDDPNDIELAGAMLKDAGLSCRITPVRTRDEFERILDSGGTDIILADYRLPMYDGMSALRLVNELRPDTPFIFVSGVMGEEAAIEALTRGATDYVLKQNMSRLVPAVRRALLEDRNRRERIRAEEALAQSEIKMRCILDTVNEGFIAIDRDYRILSVNKAYCSMTGYREDQVIGMRCYEATHQKTRPCFESGESCPVKRTFETQKDAIAFHIRTDGSGTKRHMELRSYPLADTSGTITSVVETLIDVTEKHRLQEQLALSRRMESIARLAGGVAHDFNNMLSVIMGRAELIMAQMDPHQPIYADMKEILKASKRSATMVSQLLAFARIQPVAPKAIDLNETVASMLKMLHPLIGDDVDLVWRPGKDVWPVKMDPRQIDQILANLCINARDAIAGVGRITIETDIVTIDPDACTHDPESVPGKYVSLSISDDGCGMDRKTLSNIFEPFFTTKGIGKGSGLGLSTVYGIVKQNSGFLNVSSEPGYGTTFKLYLPRYDGE